MPQAGQGGCGNVGDQSSQLSLEPQTTQMWGEVSGARLPGSHVKCESWQLLRWVQWCWDYQDMGSSFPEKAGQRQKGTEK